MKKSKAATLQTRKKIVEAAAGTFRSKGIDATGIAEIMAAVGLTHGGFYRHFESKQQLVAEACAASMDQWVALSRRAAQKSDAAFLKHLEDSLSAEPLGEALGGCPFVAVGSELARADARTRRAASLGFKEMIDVMAERQGDKDPRAVRAEAIFMVSSMIGALTTAKIMDDPLWSKQILEVVRKRLLGHATAPLRS